MGEDRVLEFERVRELEREPFGRDLVCRCDDLPLSSFPSTLLVVLLPPNDDDDDDDVEEDSDVVLSVPWSDDDEGDLDE